MKRIIFFLILGIVFLYSCKKTENLEQSRLFRPVVVGQLLADSNTIVAAWQKISAAKSYLLQVSRDSFRTVDRSISLDSNIAIVKGLLYNQLYQLQVKAIAPDTVLNSRWSNLGGIKTLTSILKVPLPTDITLNSVRVSWTTKGALVTSVKIIKTSDSSTVSTTILTPLNVTSENVIVTGLAAATKYTIFLYSGTDVRGYADFISKAPFVGSVINLTGITGRPSVLADTLATIPSGSTVLLKRGEVYTISSAISLSKSVIITSAPDLSTTVQAKIFFTSNFNFAAGAIIDSLEFNDVYMYSDNFGSRYLFNTTNSATIGKIKFINSRIEIFRGMLRLQSGTTTVNNYIIENSIIDSINDYGILTVAATTKVENVSITNSTIYKTVVVITSASAATSVLIDACTFHEAPNGNSTTYYINYGTTLLVANGITVTNCLFGPGKNSAGAFTVRDYRAAPATLISATNNHRTSDHLSAGNDFPNIATYNRTAAQLWVDPANGNFKIADGTFPARFTAGDPRWQP